MPDLGPYGNEENTMARKIDQLYIDDVVMVPRGDCALWVGRDFPCPEKVNVRDCHIVGRNYVPRFWRRSRLRRLRRCAARVSVLRTVNRALDAR